MKDPLLLAFVIVERTRLAKILGKINSTLFACFSLVLLAIAPETPYAGHFCALKLMILFRVNLLLVVNFIVAQAARIKLTFANVYVWTH